MQAIYKYRLQITFLLVAISVIGGAYAAYTGITRAGKVAVNVSVLPTYATIMANDTRIHNGISYLKAGEYTVTVTADGFETSTQNIKINATEHYISVAPAANSDKGKQWQTDHHKLYLAFESAFAKDAAAAGSAIKAANPILTHLPYHDAYYAIGYTKPTPDTVVVTVITPSPRYRYLALKQIQAWGIDPTSLTIDFTSFKNPLGN